MTTPQVVKTSVTNNSLSPTFTRTITLDKQLLFCVYHNLGSKSYSMPRNLSPVIVVGSQTIVCRSRAHKQIFKSVAFLFPIQTLIISDLSPASEFGNVKRSTCKWFVFLELLQIRRNFGSNFSSHTNPHNFRFISRCRVLGFPSCKTYV